MRKKVRKLLELLADRRKEMNEMEKLVKLINDAKRSAFKRAIQQAKTKLSSYIRERYNIKESDLDEQISIANVKYNEATGELIVSHKPMPLVKFKAKQIGKGGRPVTKWTFKKRTGKFEAKTKRNYKTGVKATVIKNNSLLYRSKDKERGSFIATMKQGHTGVFIRKGKDRNIVELFGVSAYQLVRKPDGKIQVQLNESFIKAFEERFTHEFNRKLK